MDALLEEERRLEPAMQMKDYKNYSFIHHSYKRRGHYGEQLKRYLKFFPQQKVLILTSEEFFQDQHNTLNQVTDFTGVDSGFKVKDSRPRNVAKNKEQVSTEVYQYLNEYFKPHNEALYGLLGKNLGW
jgi:hypothetical protein